MDMTAASVPAAPSPELRLTRRGRLLALTAFVVLLLGMLGIWSAGSVAVPPGSEPARTRPVVVTPGQTLWEIAAVAQPAADPRATIEQILELNGLSAPVELQVGQRVAVPVG